VCRQAKGACHAHSSDAARPPRPARHQRLRRTDPWDRFAHRRRPGAEAISGRPGTDAHVDRNILFMVYTSGGRYQAAHLLPGRYEVTVRTTGLAADPQTIVLEAGAARHSTSRCGSRRPSQSRQGEFGFTTRAASEVQARVLRRAVSSRAGARGPREAVHVLPREELLPEQAIPRGHLERVHRRDGQRRQRPRRHGAGRDAERPGSRDPAPPT